MAICLNHKKMENLKHHVSDCSNLPENLYKLLLPRIILGHFKVLNSKSLTAKDNHCLLSRLNSLQLHTGGSFYHKLLASLKQLCF